MQPMTKKLSEKKGGVQMKTTRDKIGITTKIALFVFYFIVAIIMAQTSYNFLNYITKIWAQNVSA